MKLLSIKVCMLLGFALMTSECLYAQNSGLGDLLNKIGNRTPSSTTNTEDEPVQQESGLGALFNKLGGNSNASESSSDVSAIGSALGGLLGGVLNLNGELTVTDMQGTWRYAAPSCKFQSEDFLKSAGGAVVATSIANKLAPYYEKLGFSSSSYSYTFDEKGDFSMTFGKIPLQGSISKAEKDAYFQMEFIKLGNYALAKTPVYVEISGNKMLMLYEIDKFIEMFKSVIGNLGISTLDSIFSLLDGYDGILVGFEMEKVK